MAAPARSIVLIGFMGSGKSTVGRLLARQLGWPRFDTDELIAGDLGLPISDIFTKHGEDWFREAESETLRKLQPGTSAIIVTGGGIVLRAANVRRLRELGTIVWLTADLETLQRRLARRKDRPLLQTTEPATRIATLLEQRREFYEAAADFAVDTTQLDQAAVAQAIRDGIEIAS